MRLEPLASARGPVAAPRQFLAYKLQGRECRCPIHQPQKNTREVEGPQ